jgi:hypothetical protein
VISSLAYLKLLGTKMLDCCCCCKDVISIDIYKDK